MPCHSRGQEALGVNSLFYFLNKGILTKTMISQEIIYFLRCTTQEEFKILKTLAGYTWVCRTALALELLDETQLSTTLSDLEEKGLVVTATFPTFYDGAEELAIVALAGCHCDIK
jgi:hypothetical protein